MTGSPAGRGRPTLGLLICALAVLLLAGATGALHCPPATGVHLTGTDLADADGSADHAHRDGHEAGHAVAHGHGHEHQACQDGPVMPAPAALRAGAPGQSTPAAAVTAGTPALGTPASATSRVFAYGGRQLLQQCGVART